MKKDQIERDSGFEEERSIAALFSRGSILYKFFLQREP